MTEELKRYEEKVQRCVEGISHTLRSHAQVQADHARRLAKLEEARVSQQLGCDPVQDTVVDHNNRLDWSSISSIPCSLVSIM